MLMLAAHENEAVLDAHQRGMQKLDGLDGGEPCTALNKSVSLVTPLVPAEAVGS